MKDKKKYYRKITEPLPQTSKKSKPKVRVESISSLKEAPANIINSLNQSSKISILGREITIYFMWFLGICAVFLFLVVIVLFLSFEQGKGRWLAARDNYLYWNEVAKVQANSPDAYYQAGVYALELGKNQEGYSLLQKAIDLDPEFEKAKQLQKQLTLSN